MFFYLFVTATLVFIVHIVFNYNEKARTIRRIPGPSDAFIFGNALEILCSSVELMKLARRYARTWKGIYRMWMFPFGAVNIYNPEDIEVVMSSIKHSEKSAIYKILKPWLQEGLLLSKGKKWQERRKILTPAFHFNILRQFSHVMVENSQRLLNNLDKIAGQAVDVAPILSEFTLHSICETAMGTKLSETTDANSYKEAIYDLGYIFFQRFIKTFYLFDFIFNLSPLGKRQAKYLKTVHNFTEKVIKDRKDHLERHGNRFEDVIEADDDILVYKKKKIAMLDLLISAEKEGFIDKKGIQEEVDTFMFEGHDTTASGLTFCLMLLANHKDIQDKIVEELDEIFNGDKRPITIEDLPRMKYMERCIKESLRLFPPVHFISRNLTETAILSNYTVPAGTFCHIHIYDLHRRADLFPNPDAFDPDRFLPENSVGRHPYAYIPFSAGPRNCIGQKFAMMEMKIVIAEVMRNYVLEPVTRPDDIQMIADLVFRNDGPVKVTFVKRIK